MNYRTYILSAFVLGCGAPASQQEPPESVPSTSTPSPPEVVDWSKVGARCSNSPCASDLAVASYTSDGSPEQSGQQFGAMIATVDGVTAITSVGARNEYYNAFTVFIDGGVKEVSRTTEVPSVVVAGVAANSGAYFVLADLAGVATTQARPASSYDSFVFREFVDYREAQNPRYKVASNSAHGVSLVECWSSVPGDCGFAGEEDESRVFLIDHNQQQITDEWISRPGEWPTQWQTIEVGGDSFELVAARLGLKVLNNITELPTAPYLTELQKPWHSGDHFAVGHLLTTDSEHVAYSSYTEASGLEVLLYSKGDLAGPTPNPTRVSVIGLAHNISPTSSQGGEAPSLFSGDFNGDGYSDLVVPDDGRVHFVAGPLNTSKALLEQDHVVTVYAEYDASSFGHAIEVTDFNDDGRDDVILSDIRYPDGQDVGMVYFIPGENLGL